MNKIGLFFGPEKGSVDKVAHLIATELAIPANDVIAITKANASSFDQYSHIIFGISTIGRNSWENDATGNDWDTFAPQLKNINLENKKVAIFGLGDQLTYPDHFVNAIGWLNEKLIKCGVTVVGECSTEGYKFEDSEALVNGKFIGLPIDEDNEPELTNKRISNWVSQLRNEGF